jgi:hypothetical protein
MKSVLLLLLVSSAALADDAALLRCRAIADPTARLACYDALPLNAAETAKAPAPPAQETPEQFGLPAAKPAPVATQPEQFGLPLPKPVVVELDAVESTIPGHFDGWYPKQKIRLANGQVWQVIDVSSRSVSLTDPKVTIRRGLLSAFYMEFEHINQTVLVKRLQ